MKNSRTVYYEAGFAIHELALKAKEIYESPKAKTEDKRLLLSYVFSNLALKGDKIRPNYTLAFKFMAEWMPELNRTFELLENGSTKGKRDAYASPFPTLLRERDSNPRPIGYTYLLVSKKGGLYHSHFP